MATEPLTFTCTADEWFRVADTMMKTDPPTRVVLTAYPAAGCKTPEAVSQWLKGNGFRCTAHGWWTPLWQWENGVWFDLPPTPGS